MVAYSLSDCVLGVKATCFAFPNPLEKANWEPLPSWTNPTGVRTRSE
jgi:hypothetical protein